MKLKERTSFESLTYSMEKLALVWEHLRLSIPLPAWDWPEDQVTEANQKAAALYVALYGLRKDYERNKLPPSGGA